MKTAIIVHGTCDAHEYYEMDFPSPSNAHWLPWLQQKFLRDGVICQTPEMPTPPNPVYQDWAKTFEQFNIDQETILIGHSSGAGFLLKWLSSHPTVKVQKLILVAPSKDPNRKHNEFLQNPLDPALQDRVGEMHVLYSSDERSENVTKTKDMILQAYPKAQLHLFDNKGHFCLKHLGGPEFPELWDICQSTQ